MSEKNRKTVISTAAVLTVDIIQKVRDDVMNIEPKPFLVALGPCYRGLPEAEAMVEAGLACFINPTSHGENDNK